MITRSAIDALLQEFGASAGLEGLALSEAGRCALAFDGRVTVNIDVDENAGQLLLATVLGQSPPERSAAVHAELLAANLYWQDTAGATVALDRDTGIAILQRALIDPELDLQQLEAALLSFVDAAERLRSVITEEGPSVVEGDPAAMLRV